MLQSRITNYYRARATFKYAITHNFRYQLLDLWRYQVLIVPFLAHLPFSILRLYRITQEIVSLKIHKLCVLPLTLCIEYLNDLHLAYSSILRTRGNHNIPWSRHNISIASQKDTN
jgi:hypothetical protein